MLRPGCASARASTGNRGIRKQALKAVAIVLIGQLATACVVPRSMHVADGTGPDKSDINVRFRTTYYFRVFDYCWSANAEIANKSSYQKIVPETDTLYRYRMTGKASALGNQIKFESGTMSKDRIDPFGADVVYNSDIGGFIYRSEDDAKQEAERAAEARREATQRRQALDDFNTLADMLKETKDEEKEKQEHLKTGMQKALDQYLGIPDAETRADINALKKSVDALTAGAGTPENKKQVEEVQEQVNELDKKVLNNLAQFCAIDQVRRRGFQIMGPEGMRNFDQDTRLIMAMHSSAKPLIETLNEYSGRLLTPQVNPAEQLLPLAREITTIVKTQRALDGVALEIAQDAEKKPDVARVFEEALSAFAGEPK